MNNSIQRLPYTFIDNYQHECGIAKFFMLDIILEYVNIM